MGTSFLAKIAAVGIANTAQVGIANTAPVPITKDNGLPSPASPWHDVAHPATVSAMIGQGEQTGGGLSQLTHSVVQAYEQDRKDRKDNPDTSPTDSNATECQNLLGLLGLVCVPVALRCASGFDGNPSARTGSEGGPITELQAYSDELGAHA